MPGRRSWPQSSSSSAVIIGNHTHGLGVVRSAAQAGAGVWVVNDKTVSLARFSRHLSGYRRIPRDTLRQLDRAEAADALLNALLDLPVGPRALLFGVNEDITKFIHLHAPLLRGKYFVPDVAFDRIYDKHTFNSLMPEAARLDTRLCSATDLAAIDDPHRFILKGRQGNAFRRITGEKALRFDRLTPEDVVDLFEHIAPDQVVVQELVESDQPVVSLCSFSVDGQVSGRFEYEKLRQHPNRFGTGTYLRSVRAAELEALADEILARLDFTGISELEFIRDNRTGTYKVVEMNPRTWKSIHFATQCGENLVARYLTFVATGETGSASVRYDRNRYWADLATDIPQMFRERKLWGYERGFFECTWSRSDLRPGFALWALFPLMAAEACLPFREVADQRTQKLAGNAGTAL
jgi:predicted ATP-grasp superfamily ATP-dependent carboligase